MERLVKNAIVQHMTTNNLFSEAQHGFLKGKSCVTQLLEYLEDITEAMDNGNDVDVIYLDFCKPFDKIPHRMLLNKLEKYGIKGKVLNWMKEFLSVRQQRGFIKRSSSTWTDIASGVPQGSFLGTTLFLVYINDLPEAIDGLVKIFADDMKVYQAIESADTPELLQNDVGKSEYWGVNGKCFTSQTNVIMFI